MGTLVMAGYTFQTADVKIGRKLKDKLGLGRDIRRDLVTGFAVAIDRDNNGKPTGAGFVSACCTAAVTYSEVTLCCKKCWRPVDHRLDQLIDVASI